MPYYDIRKIIILVAVIFIAILLLFLFFRFAVPERGADRAAREREGIEGRVPGFPETVTVEGEIPDIFPSEEFEKAAEARLKQITDFSVLGPALSKNDDRIFYYKKDGGSLLAYNFLTDTEEKMSNITVVGMSEVFWTRARDRAAVFYLDRDTKKGFLHIDASSVSVLPANVYSFSWSPNGSALAYVLHDSEGSQILVSNASGNNKEILFRAPLRDALLRWVRSDTMVLETAPSGFSLDTLFAYSRTNGVFSKLRSDYGMSTLWSPSGTRFLVSRTNSEGKSLRLTIANSSGEDVFSTGLATLAEKCAWSSETALFCAIPGNIPRSAVMPDDYLRSEFHTSDRIVRIDIEKEQIHEIFNEGDFDVSDLLASENEDILFFVDKRDGTLWSYRLK